MSNKCLLTGLDIPEEKESTEHLVSRSRLLKLVEDSSNIIPVHRAISLMKGDLLPCEFEHLKQELARSTLNKLYLPEEDKDFIRRAVINWNEGYNPNWCDICLLNCKHRQR